MKVNIKIAAIAMLGMSLSVKAQNKIGPTGNVGIGTTNPSEKLEINGNIKGPGAESSIVNFKNIIGRKSDGILHLRSGNSTGPIFLNYYESGNISLANGGGNVGIGTTNPDKQLTLKTNTFLGWEYTGAGSGSHHTITGGGINPMSFTVKPFSANTPIFKFNGYNGTKVTILNGGNVGIGTINPSSMLTVIGDSGIELKNKTTNENSMVIKPFLNVTNLNPGASSYAAQITNQNLQHLVLDIKANDDQDSFAVRTDTNFDGSVDKIAMVIKPSGNMGIGTTDPNSILTIVGDSGIELKNKTTNENSMVIKPFLNVTNLNPGASSYAAQITNQNLQHLVLDIKANDDQDSFAVRTDTNFDGNVDKIAMVIKPSGNVGIGTTKPDSELSVNGKIHTKEVKVDLVGWSDFVFYDDYELPTLTEVETHIKENGHLKDIPSAKEVAKNGILLGEMDSKLLQKIEELTLYTIQQEKNLQSQKEEINNLKKENETLKSLNFKLLEIQKRLDKLEGKK